MTIPIPVGAHVRSSEDPIAEALQRGADAAQIFVGDPKSWKKPQVTTPGGAAALKAAAEEAGVRLYIHAPYLINVATTNNRVRVPSRRMLQQQVDIAAEIGAAGVIVHGGHVPKDDPIEAGFDNWRKAVDQLEGEVPILIENTAGGSQAMARGVEKIERLWEAVRSADGGSEVGFCLDTCHAFAGGEELPGLADRIRAITGRIDLVHANDSRDTFDSGADRHANLGAGTIDPEDLATVIREAAAPVVVETPGEAEDQAADVEWVRRALAG
ncbi:deoxyribonuclease IV [Bogoriella caseilytica]|uniref:Deoxyribonuclease-4 n=1 Tax=Bogoriella caseilytica TaxID=56055 RepID=A0A3N2BAI7_9MICO|nr:deoxyribonuclease IV [Bogoriella caseilytica]ROR72265.1 deoxyribonuclease-4 [Bogoriella caseilytica]